MARQKLSSNPLCSGVKCLGKKVKMYVLTRFWKAVNDLLRHLNIILYILSTLKVVCYCFPMPLGLVFNQKMKKTDVEFHLPGVLTHLFFISSQQNIISVNG